jgi:hypothetical protein
VRASPLHVLISVSLLGLAGCASRPPIADTERRLRLLACTAQEQPSDAKVQRAIAEARDGRPLDEPEATTLRDPSPRMLAASERFEQQRWDEAIALFRGVSRGEAYDDLGNREVAQFKMGVALRRSGDPVSALGVFARIAEDPSHAAHHDTLFELVELVYEAETTEDAIDLARLFARENYYAVDERDPELASTIQFVWGRGHYRAGAFDEALHKMAVARRSPRLAKVADVCAHLIENRRATAFPCGEDDACAFEDFAY